MRAQARPGSLGSFIRSRRQELGLSQEELAARMSDWGDEVRQSDISRLERGGVGLPRRRRLEALAAVLEAPLGVLLERSGWTGAAAAFETSEPPAQDAADDEPPVVRSPGRAATSDRLRSAVERAWELEAQARDLVARSEQTLRKLG